VRALILFLAAWLYRNMTLGRALVVAVAFSALGVLVYGWFWYPRTKAKGQRPPTLTDGTA